MPVQLSEHLTDEDAQSLFLEWAKKGLVHIGISGDGLAGLIAFIFEKGYQQGKAEK